MPVLLCILFWWFRMPVFGQEAPDPSQEPTAPEQGTDREAAARPPGEDTGPQPAGETPADIFYIIQAIRFDITGRTRPLALLDAGEFEQGEVIQGEAGLERYIKDKTQLLRNQRVLDAVTIDYATGAPDAQGVVPVDLLISVTDTWNIIVLPRPQYDSNNGFDITLKGRDYNFLGTMNALRIDLGYQHDEHDKNRAVFQIDSDTPFHAFGYTWNFNFDHDFSYTLEDPIEESLYYKNTTGISMQLPYQWTTVTFGFEEALVFHEENDDEYKPEYGNYDDWYMSSELYTSWKIPIGIAVHTFGELAYTPKVAGVVKYPDAALEYFRKGPTLTLSHSLGFGRIDWLGNYRSGLEASLENAYAYNFHTQSWDKTISLSVASHTPLWDFFGISGRFRYRHWFDDAHDAGDALRGILDKSVHVNYMVSLNLDFPFRLLRFTPSQWLGNRKFRLFNFELHASPFIDAALVSDPPVLLTGGLELIVFPEFMRSFYVRASIGWNILELVKTGSLPTGENREIFVGIGHHY
ncbi:MAG: hypothetical protein LBQ30_10095 [Treponema sp.]|jgi:hypothetical protein|nr:hypothetical protein [Treponema sp.]